DGADEVDPHLNLIKGGGGALLREKIVASASAQRVIMVDSSKPVDVLGAFGVPVEIVPFAVSVVRRSLEKMGAQTELRSQGDSNAPFRTDENNFIVDCAFGDIPEPAALALRLSTIAGVVDHGLFCAMTEVVLIGGPNGVETRTRAAAGEPADP
ncbi:MAG: ribose 5-phosphate isomerase A, partial [Myxococcota bacterium]